MNVTVTGSKMISQTQLLKFPAPDKRSKIVDTKEYNYSFGIWMEGYIEHGLNPRREITGA